ncbi:MAG: D-lactate dehydrogenase VanH-A [Clostridiales bacterium]|jgi:lactate dehydrogenase-like 2-hydroxyacid dehydrogenase|nr:D-lactate dehydrogenase VanH-A [Clostridiales bacterium]
MENVGIAVFGCERDEADAFGELSPRFGVSPAITGEPVSARGAALARGCRCVSVSHKSRVCEPSLAALREAGVKYVSTRSAGVDHIDVEAARRLGIAVGNVAYSPAGVADYALMLMLMAMRNAKSIVAGAAKGDFRLGAARGKELRDMTVGVVGAGRIGRAVIERLRGFGCQILACGRSEGAGDEPPANGAGRAPLAGHAPPANCASCAPLAHCASPAGAPSLASPTGYAQVAGCALAAATPIHALPAGCALVTTCTQMLDRAQAAGHEPLVTCASCAPLAHHASPAATPIRAPLRELLAKSDIVTLHAPLNASTYHMIGCSEFEAMKPGAFLVNTGRGALVDTGGLIAALESGALGGAALDVLEGEDGLFYFDCSQRPIGNQFLQKLQGMPNVIITPHTAYYTGRALYDTVEKTILNCLDFERSQSH